MKPGLKMGSKPRNRAGNREIAKPGQNVEVSGGSRGGQMTVAELVPDPANRRVHNARNLGLVVDALRDVGAARSIVIDEDNVVLAGNGVTEAAVAAGLTRVQVVDADGATIIAVRRTGLTAEQKRALAMYDNRSAELAAWNPEQLRADVDAGLTLAPYWTEDELAALLQAIRADAVDAPAMLQGGKEDFEQITFILHRDQAGTVRAAIEKAKAAGATSSVNANGNGNALALICQAYCE